MSNAAASAIRDGPIRPAIVFEFAMDCLPARCRCGTRTDKNTHREEPVRRGAAPVRHRPSAVGNEPKRNARRPCTITQRLGAEEGDTPVEQQPAAMQDFDPTYDRCGSKSAAAFIMLNVTVAAKNENGWKALSAPGTIHRSGLVNLY